MHRFLTRLMLVGLAVALTGCGYGALKKRAAAQEQEITDLRSLNDTLTQQLTNSRADALRLQAELERRPTRSALAPETPRRKPTALEPTRAALANALSGSGTTVSVREGRVVVTASVGFQPGKDALTTKGASVLKQVGAALKAHCPTWEVGVAGHSDASRIAKASTRRRFPTNWHLSGFRALAAMNYLVKHCGLKASRVHFRGYGQYHPVTSNKTSAGRAKNRRLEIILAPPK